MIQAVVWDIGRVLIEWEPERFYDSAIGVERRKALFAAVDLHEFNLDVDRGQPFLGTWQAAARAHPDFADDIMLWHDRWIDMASPAIPRSVRMLTALKAKGVPLLALTNFGVETFEIARAAYLFLDLFDRRYVSGQLRLIKPDAGIYAALEQDSGFDPQGLLFTDDRPENIEAAAARGWQTHLFDGPAGWADCLIRHGLLTKEETQ